MKKTIFAITAFAIITNSCSELQSIAGDIATEVLTGGTDGSTTPALTNTDVISGLKEALTVGIKNSVNLTSVENGFFKNARIKLPFPEDAQKVKQHAIKLGMENQVNKFEQTLNRSAEEACKEATPIFVNAIKNMSIEDGFTILKGQDNAATDFLRRSTEVELRKAFRPKAQNAIETVSLTKYWEPLASTYNATTLLTGNEKVNTDLSDYVTSKAIDGLFIMVADEEKKIRKDPAARVTDILQKVFSSLDQ